MTALQESIYSSLSVLANASVYKHLSESQGYIALATAQDSEPNTNAVTIWRDGKCSFFTHDHELIESEIPQLVRSRSSKPHNQDKYHVHDVTPQMIANHQEKFRKLVNNSLTIVGERQRALPLTATRSA